MKHIFITIILLLTACSQSPDLSIIDESTWLVNGVKIHHFEQGTGQPVLMIHGGPGYPFMEPFPALEALGNDYQFIYFDQRGCGRSERPITGFDSDKTGKNIWELMSVLGYKNHLSDFEAIRQHFGQEKIVLYGHSFGAVLATLYALEYPGHVAAMILVSPAPLLSSSIDFDVFQVMQEKLSEEALAGFEQFKSAYFDMTGVMEKSEDELVALNNQFGKYWMKAMNADGGDYEAPASDPALAGGFMTTGIYFSFGKSWDFTKKMSNIRAPALIIHGANDLQPQEISAIYHDLLPNSKMAVIEDASHFAYLEQPEIFTDIIKEFLNSIPQQN